MIAIVDYGAGNLNSVKKAFDYLGAEVVVTDQPEIVDRGGQDRIAWSGAFFLSASSGPHRLARSLAASRLRGQAVSRNLPGNAVAFRRQ